MSRGMPQAEKMPQMKTGTRLGHSRNLCPSVQSVDGFLFCVVCVLCGCSVLSVDGLFDLSGRRILITGSNGGLGFELARGLARHGARVILNGRNPGKLQAAVDKLRSEDLAAGKGRPSTLPTKRVSARRWPNWN
jgi:hypothetical protein